MSRLRLPCRSTLICEMLGLCAIFLFVSCDRSDPHAPPAVSGSVRSRQPEESPRVFTSPLAGSWYPADKQELTDQIDTYLLTVSGERLKDVCALILPHAGYRWSGPTAAHAVGQLQPQSFQRVLVIGPSHRVPMPNVASVPDFTHYATPLGRVPLDRPFMAQLRKHPEFQNIPSAHEQEHSVQIELPMLQRVLGDFLFVPIVVGELDLPTLRRMGSILGELVDSKTLVVASSDFTHYGANFQYVPFTDDVPDKLKNLDDGAIELLCNKDVAGWFDYIKKTEATICGRYAIGVLLSMLPAEAKVHQLHYDTSGRMLGDYSSSVSYSALAVTGKWPRSEWIAPAEETPRLSADEQQRLLGLARGTLTYALEHREMPAAQQLGVDITPAMEQIAGAFVTLVKHGQLRGCVGQVIPDQPLYETVMRHAIHAGLNDRRFPPVKASELDDIEFEVSVLTPPRRVASPSEITIGVHGIILNKSGCSSLFLPQVAPQQGWDLETTLAQLSQKAGLPPDAWRSGSSFEVFEAIVFGEHK